MHYSLPNYVINTCFCLYFAVVFVFVFVLRFHFRFSFSFFVFVFRFRFSYLFFWFVFRVHFSRLFSHSFFAFVFRVRFAFSFSVVVHKHTILYTIARKSGATAFSSPSTNALLNRSLPSHRVSASSHCASSAITALCNVPVLIPSVACTSQPNFYVILLRVSESESEWWGE
jgi:hypothetical protein